MANANKYFTLDNINDVIEIFEDFLKEHGIITIPESEKEKAENNDPENDTLIYGMVYGDLQYELFDYFVELANSGTIPKVVNSWDTEVAEWEENEYDN